MIEAVCRDVYQGEQLALQVLDRSLARITTHEEPYAVISITDPHLKHPQLAESPHCKAVLRLMFSDVSSDFPALRGPTVHIAAFTPETAREIVNFVQEQMKNDVRLLVVHCEAGMSRSARVATAISQFYNHDETHFLVHHRPNSNVRRLVLEALESEQGRVAGTKTQRQINEGEANRNEQHKNLLENGVVERADFSASAWGLAFWMVVRVGDGPGFGASRRGLLWPEHGRVQWP